MTITRILCPIDFSATSQRALDHAVSFARLFAARLAVMHVVPTFEPRFTPPQRLDERGTLVVPVSRDEVVGALQREAARAGEPRADVVAAEGEAATAVLEKALAWQAELIVIGTHGRRGMDHALIGSVAERVIHRAPCAVLTVPVSAPAPTGPGLRRILCLVDFSPGSLQALGFATELARKGEGTLSVLHVVDWPFDDQPPVPPHSAIAQYRGRLRADARERLQSLAPVESFSGLAHLVVAGDVKAEIGRQIAAGGVDVIVMGAQSRSGLGLALLGSTTERVVRHAPCPVLTLRGPVTWASEATVDR